MPFRRNASHKPQTRSGKTPVSGSAPPVPPQAALHMGADGCRCASRSSKPVRTVSSRPGGFDSHMPPPEGRLPAAVAVPLSDFLNFFQETLYTGRKICYSIGRCPEGVSFEAAPVTGNGYAPVAQLDRALDSDSKGRWFESSRAYQKPSQTICLRRFLYAKNQEN